MNILAISDVESKAIWDHYQMNKITGVDLIISCGDLNPHYLQFLETMTNLPLLYVHGNHDDCYRDIHPDGCICIDDRVYVYEGIRILGLGGCLPYKPGDHMYSEEKMKRRIRRIARQIKKHGGIDILVTHAPARGMGDGDDMPHMGYECFLELMEKYAPKYMLHGHMHLFYDHELTRTRKYCDTTIINTTEKYQFEY